MPPKAITFKISIRTLNPGTKSVPTNICLDWVQISASNARRTARMHDGALWRSDQMREMVQRQRANSQWLTVRNTGDRSDDGLSVQLVCGSKGTILEESAIAEPSKAPGRIRARYLAVSHQSSQDLLNFLAVFGDGNPLFGIVTLGITVSIAGVLLDILNFYRYQSLRDKDFS